MIMLQSELTFLLVLMMLATIASKPFRWAMLGIIGWACLTFVVVNLVLYQLTDCIMLGIDKIVIAVAGTRLLCWRCLPMDKTADSKVALFFMNATAVVMTWQAIYYADRLATMAWLLRSGPTLLI